MLIGRESEVAVVAEALEAAFAGSARCLVIRGEAGIGKTALLEHASQGANGFQVLQAGGFESEAEMPYAVLHQLLYPLLGRLEALPAPQAAALRAALGFEPRQGVDRLLVGVAALTLLAHEAETDPLLCLVDDAHWADRESVDTISFVARRLRAERIALVAAARDGERAALAVPGVRELRLGPLAPSDARQLLESRYGRVGPEAEAILERASGNPLALLELAVRSTGGVASLTTVEQTYAEAICGLPAETQALLALVAADDAADLGTLAAAGRQLGADIAALEAAELAGLVAVGAGTVAFKHPLVRSAAYGGATFEQRRRAHLALADVLAAPEDADRRAWHRAAATVGRDEEVAAELERSAERALARSGYAAAATALERAARLSSRDEARARRLVDAAAAASLAGQRERTVALLGEADLAAADPMTRVEAARTRGVIEAQFGSPIEATKIFLAAASEAYPLDRRAALDLVTLAQESAGLAGALEEVVELGRWGDRLGEGETREEQIMLGLVRGFAAISAGDRAGAATPLGEAVERGQAVEDPRMLVWAATAAMFLGDEERVFELLQRAVREARARSALAVLPFALHLLAGVERRRGNVAAAEADADESLRLAQETGQEVVAAGALSTLTALAAFRGDVERAEKLAAETRGLASPGRRIVALAGVERAIAELELARGRAAEAFERLDAIVGRDPLRLNAPYTLFATPILVEAAVRSGRHGRAGALLAAFEGWAEAGQTKWAPPLAARCRALMTDSEADADAWFRRAVELHAAHEHPYESARTNLLYGEFLRRARRKTEARAYLRAAVEAFDSLGARLWAERATAELRATGATARRRDESARGELTPQELQIVRLVAVGKTNREVAAQLFLSPKTVQYHLGKVFVKLGIASRTELTRLVVQGAIAGAAAAETG